MREKGSVSTAMINFSLSCSVNFEPRVTGRMQMHLCAYVPHNAYITSQTNQETVQ